MRIILFTLFLLSNNAYCQPAKSKNCFKYPKKIVKLNSKDLYDNARWILFNWIGTEKLDETYYGQMDLIFKGVTSRNDTTLIHFGFYDSEVAKPMKNKANLVAKATVAFKQSSKKSFWAFIYPFAAPSRGLTSENELLDLQLSDSTANFLATRRELINKCYLDLARKIELLK